MKNMKSIAIGAALVAAAGGVGCGGGDSEGPLGDVDALVVLQRVKRNDMGDIFQYTSYKAGGRLVKLIGDAHCEALLFGRAVLTIR